MIITSVGGCPECFDKPDWSMYGCAPSCMRIHWVILDVTSRSISPTTSKIGSWQWTSPQKRVDELKRAVAAHLDDPETAVFFGPYIQAWGRKPG